MSSVVAGLDGREIEFAQQLASNKLKVRNKTLNKLQKFIGSLDEESVTDDELLKLWKGLFYCFWMSDKVKVQQELALNMACLLHNFPSPTSAFQFLKCFYITMNREWHGIDNLRLNKFYSLQRRFLEESLKIAVSDIFNKLADNKDEEDEDEEDGEEEEQVSETIFSWCSTMNESINEDCPGVILHYLDIFVESLEKALPKASPGKKFFTDLEMNGLLLPAYNLIQFSNDIRIVKRVKSEIFMKLLAQKFDEEFEADESMEFDSDVEKHNFFLSGTRKYFPYFDGIEEALLAIATSKDTLERNRTHVFELQERFQKIRVPPKPILPETIKYKPPTSEEAKEMRKKRKKKRKKPATKKPAKKKARFH